MSPADGKRLDIRNQATARIQANGNGFEATIVLKNEVLPGTVVFPHGLTDQNLNALIPSGPAQVERISGQHVMTGAPVEVRALARVQARRRADLSDTAAE